MARPLPVFGSVLQMTHTEEAPHNVRVFENGRFLYAAFDGGREMILDVRAHDRMDLLQYWHEWMKPAPTPEQVQREPVVAEHVRTPERRAHTSEEPPGVYLTSLGSEQPKQRRMTLEEFLVA